MMKAVCGIEVRVRVGKAWRITFVALSLLVAFGVPGNALMLKRSLNDLVGQAATIAVGNVTAIGYEVVDGHALTNVTIAREAHPELGGETGSIEFSVPGGPVGDQIEWVSDMPTFKVGDRALVMLRQGAGGRMGVVGGIQGKLDVSETLLADISAIRAGSAPSSMPAPVSASTLDCCTYLAAGDTQPIRWFSSCPSISFKIYDNSGVTGAATAIRNAATSWNAVACSCARLSYGGTATAAGDGVCSWANLADGLLAYTRITSNASPPHNITAFEVQFNTDYPWSTSCAYNGMDVETVALHEFGHVLALVDQPSGTCPTSVMCADQPLGLCKHDPTPDAACLAGLYVTAPAITAFAINGGAANTSSRDVTLNNTASCYPTQYIASESYSFSGATYADYSTAPTFTLSVTPGLKTVYLKVKNAAGVASVISDQITLLACGPPAPSNPGATNITAGAIRWMWADNSSTETGFKVYADPGAGPPIALRTTTAAGATFWDYNGLAANTQYAFQVSATDGTCDSAKTTNTARYTLAAKPICASTGPAAINCDKGCGDGSTWYPAGTNVTFTAVNGFGTGAAKASYYRYVWNNIPGPDEPSWSEASTWVVGSLVLTGNGSYYLHIQPCNGNGGGTYNTDTAHFGPYIIDGTGPSAPSPVNDSAYQIDTTQLHASWTAAVDSVSGVCEYQYAIGASPASLIVPWKSAGTSLSATETDLSLPLGSIYYWYVKAKDCAGNWGATASSDGTAIVNNTAMGIDAAKALANGSFVGLDSKTVTAVLGSGFYVQDISPWAGIRVDCATRPAGLAAGSLVDVGGTLSTSADGEKLITGVAGLKAGTGTLRALGFTNRAMSGASRNYDAGTGAGQQGAEGGVGLNNTGMLVRVWGRLSSPDPTAIRIWNFDTDPGFTLQGGQGGWAYGVPTGGGSGSCKDPTAGYTGTNVVGYNLAGDYTNNMTSTYYATTPAVDCSGYRGVHLLFWRWLGVESSACDHASVDVSNDGTNWTAKWSHNAGTLCDGAWVSQDIDISSFADGHATVYVRWGMGVTDSSGVYPGWNIDDVKIWGTDAISTIDDGSIGGLRATFPSGVTVPASGTYISVTGVCSCVKDTGGKVRPLLKVTSWEAQ